MRQKKMHFKKYSLVRYVAVVFACILPLLAPARALANQSAHLPHVPIRTPHSSCANQDA